MPLPEIEDSMAIFIHHPGAARAHHPRGKELEQAQTMAAPIYEVLDCALVQGRRSWRVPAVLRGQFDHQPPVLWFRHVLSPQ